MKVFRKGRKLPVEVDVKELGRVAGDNSLWVWYNPDGEPEVVYREEPEDAEEE